MQEMAGLDGLELGLYIEKTELFTNLIIVECEVQSSWDMYKF